MEDVRWPAEQLEEHRLEISNRIRNLFWTVSGDYDMEFEKLCVAFSLLQ